MDTKEQLNKNSSLAGQGIQVQVATSNLSLDKHSNNKIFKILIFILLLLVIAGYLFYQSYSVPQGKEPGTALTSAIKKNFVVNQPLSTSSQISVLKPAVAKYTKITFPEISEIKEVLAKSLSVDLESLIFSNTTEAKLQKIVYHDLRTGVFINYNIQLTVTDFFKKFNNISGLTILGGSYTEVLGTFDYQYNSKNLRVTATDNDKSGIAINIQTIND